jgi:hypothetical protein
MPKLLTRLRIDEVSAVDRGAGENVKIMLMKRHKDVAAKAVAALEESVASILGCDDDDATKRYALAESFAQFQTYMQREAGGGKPLGKVTLERTQRRHRQAFEKILSKADDDDHDASDDPVRAPAVDHHISRLADLVAEGSDGKLDRAAALRWLLHHRDGIAMARTHKREDETMSTGIESLENIVKSHGVAGVVAIAKNITEADKSYALTETEFVHLIDTAARVAHSDLGARAFEKVYERNPVLAKAIAVIKAWPSPMSLVPTLVGGPDAMHEAIDDTEQSEAYQKLVDMAERQRRAGESASQAFERVYLDPANRHLAEAERSANRPRPTTQYPFPR